jgi:hypothetical protein
MRLSMRARARSWIVLAIAVAILLAAPFANARPFDVIGGDWEGCADFVRLARDDLGDGRVRALERLDLSALRPIDSVIVLHPEKTLDVGSYARFMKDGGRVVLFDDYGTGDALLEHFSLHRIAAPENPDKTLLDNPQLAIAEPDSAHPVVAGVSRVVLNHATGIRHNDLSSLLVIHTAGGDAVNVAVAGMVGKGRFLAVGDPSIVMNRMLRYPGNRAFARGVVAYAADQDTWGRRDGYVYIVSGPFEQKGAYGEDSTVTAEWSERLRLVSDTIRSMRHEGMPPALTYALCVALGLGIVVWVGANAARVHKPITPRFTRPIPLLAQGGVAGHVAVLSARGTSRALAMLELKSALEERLGALLELDRIPSADVLLGELAARRLLAASEIAELRVLFARLAHIETMVLSRRAGALGPVPDAEVLRAAEIIGRVLQHAEAHKTALGTLGSVAAGSAPGAAVP